MTNLFFLAAEAATKVPEIVPPEAADPSWLKLALASVLGMMLMKSISWAAGWFDGKGKKWVDDGLQKMNDKINENSLMAQVQADDALFSIVRESVPEIIDELVDTAKADLKDGKLDKVDWEDIGSRLWARVKPQVIGGKNDYLANSSYSDGAVMAKAIAKKVFHKTKAKKEGLVE